MFRKCYIPQRKSRVSMRCSNVEKKRISLQHGFYSIQRPVTSEEVHMILKPLFEHVCVGVNIVNNQVIIEITNKYVNPRDDIQEYVLDLVNEWNVHDTFRKFLIKAMTAANKNKVYRYKDKVMWKCPLNVHYVFNDEDFQDFDE